MIPEEEGKFLLICHVGSHFLENWERCLKLCNSFKNLFIFIAIDL